MPAGEEVVCSEQLVTGDDENTQIRLKYKYKHTQKDKKWPKSRFGSDIASQQGFGENIRVKRVLRKKIENRRGFGFYCRFWIESQSGNCWFWLRRGVLNEIIPPFSWIFLGKMAI